MPTNPTTSYSPKEPKPLGGYAILPAEVEEKARGDGLRRAVGELLVCPYCIGRWVATALLAGYIWQPCLTRTAASLLAIVTGADFMQQLWVAVDKAA